MDRKTLIREYKEAPRTMGVYRVRNVAEDRSLLGSSTDAPAMLNRIRTQLAIGVHSNKALQADWDRLGADAFTFDVLDTLTPAEDPDRDPADELRVLEELWIERLAPFGARGYNRPA